MPKVQVDTVLATSPSRSTRSRSASVANSPSKSPVVAPYGRPGRSPSTRRSPSSSEVPKKKIDDKVIYTIEQLAPAPSQTYHHLIVYAENRVTLHSFPKRRYSTQWTRGSFYNPQAETWTYDDFQSRVVKDTIVTLFGKDVYATALAFIEGEIAKPTRK